MMPARASMSHDKLVIVLDMLRNRGTDYQVPRYSRARVRCS